MFDYGQIISYQEMCAEEKTNLQRGMNFRLHGNVSVILMSRRSNAPYSDRIESDGKILIYEGHDVARNTSFVDPKLVDQPKTTASGRLTQNGLFFEAAQKYKRGEAPAEWVRVYEKIYQGIWVFNGIFRLIDAWQEHDGRRSVFKFKLEIVDAPETERGEKRDHFDLEHSRLIPSSVKLEVWRRDQGKCRICGSTDNLHFDHILPFSKGGTSLVAENIQLLCARHNLQKGSKIE